MTDLEHYVLCYQRDVLSDAINHPDDAFYPLEYQQRLEFLAARGDVEDEFDAIANQAMDRTMPKRVASLVLEPLVACRAIAVMADGRWLLDDIKAAEDYCDRICSQLLEAGKAIDKGCYLEIIQPVLDVAKM